MAYHEITTVTHVPARGDDDTERSYTARVNILEVADRLAAGGMEKVYAGSVWIRDGILLASIVCGDIIEIGSRQFRVFGKEISPDGVDTEYRLEAA